MAYQTGSATDLGDLLSKLDTFLTSTPSSTILGGYTQDDFDDGASVASEGFAAWHKGSTGSGLWISMKWVANAPNNLSIHQALGHTPSNDPGDHPDDSGNGFNGSFGNDTNLGSERCINDIGDGPFPSYHFFGDATLDYVHVVVEISSESYRHFGWGNLEKFNDWTGGEYCYGHHADEALGSSAVDTGADPLFDAINAGTSGSTARRGTTIHAEGLPHQGASEKWLHHAGGLTSDEDVDHQDTAGEHKRIAFGGYRGGPLAPLAQFRSDIATGHIPMTPLAIFTRDFANDFCYFLGTVPDIRQIDIFNFAPGQEVTIGSDVWVLFPQVRRTEDNIIGRTYYAGIAYKKLT